MPNLYSKDLCQPVSMFLTPIETRLHADQTIGEAIASLRNRRVEHKVIYFYVVDSDDKLVGVIPTRTLLLNDSQQVISSCMNAPVVQITHDSTLEDAMEIFALHRLLALPVVDEQGRLLGTIDVRLYAEEAFDLAESQRTGDLFQMIGLTVEQARQGSAIQGFRLRMPWLVCNMIGGVGCAIIAFLFQNVLEAVVLLAMFIPLVLTLSESVSMQAMTISLQFLHGRRVPWSTVRRRLHLEWRTAGLLGLTSGVVVGMLSLFWGGSEMTATGTLSPGLVLALSVVISMLGSAILGLSLPVTLHALKLDPKIAAGPVVLMTADVLTTSIYLATASWLLI